jgi:hypothetical protein
MVACSACYRRHWRQPHHPPERELRRFDILARQAADVVERAQTNAALAKVRRDFVLRSRLRLIGRSDKDYV